MNEPVHIQLEKKLAEQLQQLMARRYTREMLRWRLGPSPRGGPLSIREVARLIKGIDRCGHVYTEEAIQKWEREQTVLAGAGRMQRVRR